MSTAVDGLTSVLTSGNCYSLLLYVWCRIMPISYVDRRFQALHERYSGRGVRVAAPAAMGFRHGAGLHLPVDVDTYGGKGQTAETGQ